MAKFFNDWENVRQVANLPVGREVAMLMRQLGKKQQMRGI
jgi:hypothetical protein